MDNSYLSTNPRYTDVCLLCDKQLPNNKSVRNIDNTGWNNLVSKAEIWSKIDVPLTDIYFKFTEVFSKVNNVSTAFGKRHESCRIKFSSELNKYREKYGEISIGNDSQSSSPENTNEGNTEALTKRLTRSSSEHIKRFEKKCFVCLVRERCEMNPYNRGGLGRCEKDEASSKIKDAMTIYVDDEQHRFHKAAKRVNLLQSGQSHDVYSAELYYHQSCYRSFVRIPVNKLMAEDFDDEISVLNDFFTSIRLNILRDENAYLLTQLLDDWIHLCSTRGIVTLITRTNQLRKRMEDKFGDDLGFFPSGKYVIVYSTWLNPCQYSVSTLMGAGLRYIDIAKGFAAMVKRKSVQVIQIIFLIHQVR